MNRRESIEEILGSFKAISRRIFGSHHSFFDQENITSSQWQVLHFVKHNEGVGIKEIAEKFRITSSAVTQLVEGLVAKGFLLRESDKADHRAIKIKVSGKTKKYMSIMRQKFFKNLSAIFDILSNEELIKYYEINKKIAERILRNCDRDYKDRF